MAAIVFEDVAVVMKIKVLKRVLQRKFVSLSIFEATYFGWKETVAIVGSHNFFLWDPQLIGFVNIKVAM